MTWHHVIGWDALKKAWSSLAHNGRTKFVASQNERDTKRAATLANESAAFYKILKAWVKLLDLSVRPTELDTWFSDNQADKVIEAMRSNTLDGGFAGVLEQRMCWAKWNLVEGPSTEYRHDDPSKVGFLSNIDRFPYGMRSAFQDRYITLVSLFGHMDSFTGLQDVKSPGQVEGMLGGFKSLRTHKSASIEMIDFSIWELYAAGQFEYNKEGRITNVVTHPVWRKKAGPGQTLPPAPINTALGKITCKKTGCGFSGVETQFSRNTFGKYTCPKCKSVFAATPG